MCSYSLFNIQCWHATNFHGPPSRVSSCERMKETMPSEALCIVYTCTWYDPDSLSSIRMSPFDDTSSPITTCTLHNKETQVDPCRYCRRNICGSTFSSCRYQQLFLANNGYRTLLVFSLFALAAWFKSKHAIPRESSACYGTCVDCLSQQGLAGLLWCTDNS
jgi:hypothetical protein